MTALASNIASRAMELLGASLGPEVVATMLGVTPSDISQLMSQDDFREKVTAKRFEAGARHIERDNKYDKLEDMALDQLERSLPMLVKPGEIARVATLLNSAKRRAVAAPESMAGSQPVVQLVIPIAVMQQFTTDVNNQVVRAGTQDLVTIQSSELFKHAPKLLESPSQNGNSFPSTEATGNTDKAAATG